MPQHPKYSNSPTRDLRCVYQLLDDLERYGFVHEEIHQSIDTVMAELYPDAVKELNRQENGSSNDDGEEDFSFVPGASALFYYVDGDEQPQFIQDLRNLIAHCMVDSPTGTGCAGMHRPCCWRIAWRSPARKTMPRAGTTPGAVWCRRRTDPRPVVHPQAARYSCQCGSWGASDASVDLTRSISWSYSTSVRPPRIFWNRQYTR